MDKGDPKWEILIITEEDVKSLLSMREAIEVMETVFRAYAENGVQMIPRQYVFFEEHRGKTGFMPAYIGPMEAAGVKIVSHHEKNPSEHSLPAVQATTILNDVKTGLPLAMIGATYSTMIRTGAIAAVAAKYLSRQDSKVAGIIGAGVQGMGQLIGLTEVRKLQKAFVYDISEKQRERFVKEMSATLGMEVVPVEDAEKVVRESDIVALATPALTPVIENQWISKGTHINTVGVSTPGKQEVPTETLKQSKVVVDQFDQTSRMGGINMAISAGLLRKEDIYAEIGEIVTGKKQGRESREEITVFVTSGLAFQDIAVANLVYQKAKERGSGQSVKWRS
jgi:alanine dehydrogenase